MKNKERFRFWFLGLVIAAAFSVLVVALADLQIRGGSDELDYSAAAESNMTKRLSERGSRGQILDANGALLAYDKKIYNVEFYRDPKSKGPQNGVYSKSIWEVIKLLRAEGKEIKFKFWMEQNEDGQWVFNTDTTSESVDKARQEMFIGNFYLRAVPYEGYFDKLCENYLIHDIDKDLPLDEKLTIEDKLAVLAVWQEMQMNAFNSQPIVLASDVSWGTVMQIETRLISLDGISIKVENQRVYPKGTLACHILGYTGLMQTQSQIDEYVEKGYQRNDTVGLAGVERTMEQHLTGSSGLRRGYSLVEVDRNGRKIRTLSQEEPSDGNTVKLTIDTGLQQVVETELAKVINDIRDEQEAKFSDGQWLDKNKDILLEYESKERDVNLAQNGAAIVLDMNCRVLAMASFPDFDPNLFIIGMDDAQRERILGDPRNPLFDNAIRAKSTPGSVFKMCTALAALVNKDLTVVETISDRGLFTDYDKVNPPKCWIALSRISQHADQTIVQGLSNSCNYFFYTIAARMGADGEKLYDYASKLGLTTKTNIDLPGEEQSVVGSQMTLYDPTKPITGSGQGTWYPVQVKAALKKHLVGIGEIYAITYSDERLDKCIKALMDMAVVTEQGEEQQTWVRAIRPILMEELGMNMEMVHRQIVIGDIVHYLNELKWGGTYTIQTAIGQGITVTTPIAMARYIAAIANGGYVYDVQLIDSIISPTGEVVQSFDQPTLVNDLSGELAEYLPYIHEGMFGVVDDESGTARSIFQNWKYSQQIAGKTGTAETSELDVEHNSWFVAFAPYDEPEIAVVIYVSHGLSGKMSAPAARNIIEYYLDSRVADVELILPAPNALVQ